MILFTSEFLATASLEVHQTAEQQWRAYGTSPIEVFLFPADAIAQMVEFEQGIGLEAAGDAVRAQAERIGAVAVILTAIARVAEVEIDLPRDQPGEGQRPIPEVDVAQLIGDFGKAVVTLTVWPERDLAKVLRSSIIAGLDGPEVLLSSRKGPATDPSQFVELTSWLTGLLPNSSGSSTS